MNGNAMRAIAMGFRCEGGWLTGLTDDEIDVILQTASFLIYDETWDMTAVLKILAYAVSGMIEPKIIIRALALIIPSRCMTPQFYRALKDMSRMDDDGMEPLSCSYDIPCEEQALRLERRPYESHIALCTLHTFPHGRFQRRKHL